MAFSTRGYAFQFSTTTGTVPGYPLEMRTARRARKAGFKVIQSDIYQDEAENGKLHEIDILAYKSLAAEDGSHIQLTFLIECKAPEKPFLLFDGGGRLNEKGAATHHLLSEHALAFIPTWDFTQVVVDSDLFPVNSRFSFGITQALRKPKDADVAWLAISSVTSAGLAKIKKANAITKHVPGKLIEFVFPVIVTSGRLFSCALDQNGEPKLEEVDSGIVEWRNPSIGQPSVAIDIVCENALDSFLASKAKGAGNFIESLVRELNRRNQVRLAAEKKNSIRPYRAKLK